MAGQRVGVFVGRDDAIAAMDEALVAADGGNPRIVWIEGEAGIGKTTLLRRFLATARDDRHVVSVSAVEEERSLAFELVDQLARGLAAPEQVDLGLHDSDGDVDVLAVGARLFAALGEIDGMTLLVIDDFHWADPESASALLFMLRRLRGEAVLVLLATRPDPGTYVNESWGRFLRDNELVQPVRLEGLTVEELVLLSEMTTGASLGRHGAERLQAHTAGHPMHAQSLLQEVDIDSLDRARGVLPAPRSLAATLVAKVATLPDPAQDLVATSAVLGSSAPLALVATVARVTDPLPAMEVAIAAGLLERSAGDEVRIPHSLIRGAVYNDLAPTRRWALHLAAASASDGLVALDHRIAAAVGGDPALAREVEALALEEIADGRAVLAEHHFRAAATLCSDVADRDRCLLFAAEAVSVRGDFARLRSLRPAVEACGDTPQRTYLLAAIEFASGRPEVADALTTEASAGLASMPALPVEFRARAETGLAMVRALRGRWEDAIGPAQSALELGAGSLAPYALAISLSHLGRFDELQALADRVEGERPRDDLLAGLLKVWSHDLVGAVADLTDAVSRDYGGRSSRLRLPGLCALSDAQYRLGQWDDAIVSGELAVSLATDTEQSIVLQHAHTVASYVHAGRGWFDVAERHVDAAAELAPIVPSWSGQVYGPLARAVLAQARGDTVAMRQAVSDLMEGPARASLERSPSWPWRVLITEALLGAGEVEPAQRALDDLVERIVRWGIADTT